MFRSSLSILAGGTCAGMLTSIGAPSPVESALAALLTAGAVAITDYFARKRKEAKHTDLFLREHRKTREAFRDGNRRRKKKTRSSVRRT